MESEFLIGFIELLKLVTTGNKSFADLHIQQDTTA
jgi:hypothetical protein